MKALCLVCAVLSVLVAGRAWALSGDGGTVLLVQNGKVLMSGTSGGVPYFSAATTISSSAALTANQLVIGGGAGAAPAALGSLGTTTQVLHGNAGGAPTFSAVSLTADVSGTLPIANGGTNATTFTASRCVRFDGTSLVSAAGDCATAGQNLIVFGTNGDITQSTTVWVNGSTTDISEARVQAVVANAVSLNNLKCVSSVLPGTSQTYTTTMTTGVCTGALTASTNQVCAIDNATRIGCTTPATTAQAITAGQCFAFKIVSSATAATGTVVCSVERTA
jgi:hypothetical protein